jgi:hypothetical protein
MPIKSQARLRLFTCSSSTGDLCRIKQTAGRRRRYVTMPSSSLSAASASPTMPSSKKTLSYSTVVELHPSHTIEFGTSGIFSGRVLEMQQLGYFVSHPVLEGKPNANYVRARIRTHVHSDYINEHHHTMLE